ncbi:hypothetical protein AURDEDRAFT_173769 [Auricularia subglabra TFB-10046 SS5]|nr:hypothetical protein AURDEDRAFT_173769 [Auricularia subglabra TFB-10046 SS5]
MPLNYDVLDVVSQYAERSTLAALCVVCHPLRSLVARRLYKHVQIRTWSALASFHYAVTRNADDSPARYVISLTESINDFVPESVALKTFYISSMADVVRISVNVENLSFSAVHTTIASALYQCSNLRHLRFGAALHLRSLTPPFETISFSLQNPAADLAIANGFSTFTQGLRSLSVPGIYDGLEWLVKNSHTVTFPALHSLSVGGLTDISQRTRDIFPSLRVLEVSSRCDGLRNVDVAWPHLQHLRVRVPDAQPLVRFLSPGHHVASLSLVFDGFEPAVVGTLEALASTHVVCLALAWQRSQAYVWTNCAPGLRAYQNLTCLDVAVPVRAAKWIAAVCGPAEDALPPNLAIITIRSPASSREVLPHAVAQLRARVHALRLLRITPEHHAWCWQPNRVRPDAVDWETACEAVVSALPHWRGTRSPWLDILDL